MRRSSSLNSCLCLLDDKMRDLYEELGEREKENRICNIEYGVDSGNAYDIYRAVQEVEIEYRIYAVENDKPDDRADELNSYVDDRNSLSIPVNADR